MNLDKRISLTRSNKARKTRKVSEKHYPDKPHLSLEIWKWQNPLPFVYPGAISVPAMEHSRNFQNISL